MATEQISDARVVATGAYLEGLAVDNESNSVWFSDVTQGGVRQLQAGSIATTICPNKCWVGGVLLNANNTVLVSGQGGIEWYNVQQHTNGWLVNEALGSALTGVNEMTPDHQGGLFFGTCDLDNVIASAPTVPSSLYHLAKDLTLTKIADDIGFANGLAFNPITGQLFCNDTFTGTWLFTLTESFNVKRRQKILDKVDADGMALDAQGNVWITGYQSSELLRLSPAGEIVSTLATPAGGITQLRFAGSDLRTLFFNAVAADSGENLKNGNATVAQTSSLFQATINEPGMPIPKTQFAL